MKVRAKDMNSVSRLSPPAYVTGFRFGSINNEILIVDFVDIADGEGDLSIFSSVALSTNTAKQLIDGLTKFVIGYESSEES